MANRNPFAVGEWYHCYTRGIDGRDTFRLAGDYERFIQNLYLLNSDTVEHRSDLQHVSYEDMFVRERGKPIIGIAAYCLMPNHFHLIIQEKTDGGIARFMQRLGTAYAMYFNKRHGRIGNLFVKPFRSRHITDDVYLQRVVQYVHLNPAEIFEPDFKRGHLRNSKELETRLGDYRFSSLPDFLGTIRAENSLLDLDCRDVFAEQPPFKDVLNEALEYYKEIGLADA